MSDSSGFYESLPLISEFDQSLKPTSARDLPMDWIIVLTDVVGSTTAIQKGLYRDVNTVGVLALIAIANECGHMRFPYVFGGDGMTMALPPSIGHRLRPLLADLGEQIRASYGLELRMAAMSVAQWQDALQDDLHKSAVGPNMEMWKVARHQITAHYEQCAFYGSWDLLESLFKKSTGPWSIHPVDRQADVQASFDGYSCRWQDIPSPLGLTIALIVKPIQIDPCEIYAQVAHRLGDDFHPLRIDSMQMSDPWSTLGAETRALGWGWWTVLVSIWSWLVVWSAVHLGISAKYAWMDLRQIRSLNRANADYRKFDGTLKIIAILSPKAQAELTEWLDQSERSGGLCYGLHVTDRALMTCALHVNSEVEVHFVDAADGGYAMAAMQVKEKLRHPI